MDNFEADTRIKIARIESDAKLEAAALIQRGMQAVADAIRYLARKK